MNAVVPQPQPSSGEFALEEFFLYLKDQGFPCGVGERVRAYRAYAAMRPDRTEQQMKTVLCPIFARSDIDQARFYRAHELFFGAAVGVSSAPALRKADPVELPVRNQPQPTVWQRIRPSSRRVAAVATMVITIGALMYFDVPGAIRRALTSPPPQSAQKPDARPGFDVRERRESVQTPVARPCSGSECLVRGGRKWVWPIVAALSIAILLAPRLPLVRRIRINAREQSRVPPFSWPLFRSSSPLRQYQRLLIRTADAMRRRLAGEALDLDVPRTVDATIEKAGFPTLQFRPRRRPPEYLFLIERRTPQDHLAHWWTDVSGTLRSLGVSITAYYYSGDIRRCSDASTTAINTLWLLDRFPDAHVLVFGRGRDLLQGMREIPSWMDVSLVRRDHRALLTSAASFEWSAADRKVGARLPVVPARLPNLTAVTPGAPQDQIRLRWQEATELPVVPEAYFEEIEADAGGQPPALSGYLDEDVFQWLCACAIYPKLEWHLTVRLATALDSSGALLEERKLLQLVRLPWFRDGRMPERWRAWLVKHLKPEHVRTVRESLIEALMRNPAPDGSFARDYQNAQIAAQRYWLSPGARTYAELQSRIDALPDIDIAEDALLAQLQRSEPQPGAQVELARLAQSGWRVPVRTLGLVAAVALTLFITPVSDTRTDQVVHYDLVATAAATRPAPAGNPPPTGQPQVDIFADAKADPDITQRAYAALTSKGIVARRTSMRASAPTTSELRFFAADDRQEAVAIASLLRDAGVQTTPTQIAPVSQKPVRGQYELWLAATPGSYGTNDKAQPDIERLQRLLNSAGFKTPVNGIFGAETRAALTAFQRARGLPADGIAGPATMAALNQGAPSTASPAQSPVQTAEPPAYPTQNAPPPFGQTSQQTKAPDIQQPAMSNTEFARYVHGLGDLVFAPGSAEEPRSQQFGGITGISTEVEKLLRVNPAGSIVLVGRASWREAPSATAQRQLALRRAEQVRNSLIAEINKMSTMMDWTPAAREALPYRIRAVAGSARCANDNTSCVADDQTVELQATAPAAAKD